MAVRGYAIKNKAGEILIPTVSPGERGAKVNWLLVDCKMLAMQVTSDEAIDRAFEIMKKEKGATCVRVEIKEMS